MGALYGELRLRKLSTPGIKFSEELDILAEGLINAFGVDLDDRAVLITVLRNQKNTKVHYALNRIKIEIL